MLYLSLVLLLGFVSGEMEIDYTGNSGGFKYRRVDDNNYAISVTVTEIAEYEPDGTKTGNKITNVAGGEWSTEEEGTCAICDDDTTEALVNMLTYVDADLGVAFQMTTYLLTEDSTIDYTHVGTSAPGGDTSTTQVGFTINVETNTVEFTFLITDWPFLSVDNYLVVATQFHAQGKAANYEEDYTYENDGGTVVKFEWGNDFEMDAPLVADLCHGSHTGAPATATSDLIECDAGADFDDGSGSGAGGNLYQADGEDGVLIAWKNNKMEYSVRFPAFGCIMAGAETGGCDIGANVGYGFYDPHIKAGAFHVSAAVTMVMAVLTLLFL